MTSRVFEGKTVRRISSGSTEEFAQSTENEPTNASVMTIDVKGGRGRNGNESERVTERTCEIGLGLKPTHFFARARLIAMEGEQELDVVLSRCNVESIRHQVAKGELRGHTGRLHRRDSVRCTLWERWADVDATHPCRVTTPSNDADGAIDRADGRLVLWSGCL